MSEFTEFAKLLLAKLLKISVEELDSALSDNDYTILKIAKKTEGYRTIFIPSNSLKKIQKRILKLLRKIYDISPFGLFGCHKGTSYVEHALHHANAKWVFQFDLKDAFLSVNVVKLRELLKNAFLGAFKDWESIGSCWHDTYCKLQEAKKQRDIWRLRRAKDDFKAITKRFSYSVFSLSELLNMMVKNPDGRNIWLLPYKEELASEFADLVIRLVTINGVLPQGTPTAPFLFHIAIAQSGLFYKLESILHDYHFSAYVDNFVVSAQKPIPISKQKELCKIVEEFGFQINPLKTKHQGVKYGLPLITGLRTRMIDVTVEGPGLVEEICYSHGKAILPQKVIRRWRGLIHRAIFEPALRPKVQGFISSLKPIYGEELPPQIREPYQRLLAKIQQ